MQPAVLVLEDGSVFHGKSVGWIGQTVGEVIFNTSMSGYQEILTDPSYAQQIVTFTYPHIGSVGVNPDDAESAKIWVAGLIVRDFTESSNWRSTQSLDQYLKDQRIVGIAGVDTRRLTRILREKGALRGCISTDVGMISQLLQLTQTFPGLNGLDLAQVVSVTEPYEWTASTWLATEDEKANHLPPKFHVIAYDFGVKRNILRALVQRGCRVTVVPGKTSAEAVLAYRPDGVFLSNGPGDPAPCDYAIAAIKEFLIADIPLFGICLGFQLLALACGAKTEKMKFGHHGANHPVLDVNKQKVLVTSQNHGFAVVEASLPPELQITHRSLFDQTIQGIRHRQKSAFAFQGHPEASPGPHDVLGLFDEFIDLMKQRRS